MIDNYTTKRKGFTLVELAIVLAVIAVLFTGLYRLLSNGNSQSQDSAAANQQIQLINAVKSFLSSADGQSYMGGKCPAGGCAGLTFTIPLPTTTKTCATDVVAASGPNAMTPPQATTWCNILPSGFTTTSVNSYNQTFGIQVMYNTASTGANTPPLTYSFMIKTKGGYTIPDGNGARIASTIGGDGGFVYATGTCGAGLLACGSNGAWNADPTTYGYTAASVAQGQIASRTYIALDQQSSLPWLARLNIDTAVPPVYNTMTTDLYMNKTGSGSLNAIYGTGDQLTNPSSYGGSLIGFNQITIGNNDAVGAPLPENAALTLFGPSDPSTGSACVAKDFSLGSPYTDKPSSGGKPCHPVLQIFGNQTTSGMVEAQVLWSASFLYGTIIPPSDLRLKKDVHTLEHSLDNIMMLKPVTFKYKKDNRPSMGFIAQDLEKIYPQMVLTSPDGMRGVEYFQLLAPIVDSVQELKKQNDQLTKQINIQQKLIEKLQAKLDAVP